ncbi:hypothetical protein [Tissierella sp. Yu-01]|uniref:hypothetical protein n=1 Tax=Tissierella sp. Yu-01 TaxID=3035694 RepID=UPI00240DDB57|nr:hypothetical protein [Tissierella sp. Yu-01]WFA09684.1 hypothetical protein P3962_03760 [Tissierella sp. Yu-01]
MKKNGFITIFVIFIMIISFIIVLYIIHLVHNQTLIEAAYQDKIQSELLAESKILRLFYDDHYLNDLLVPNIHYYFKNQSAGNALTFELNFDSNMDEDDLIQSVNGRFFNMNDRKYVGLETKTNYKGFTSNAIANGTIVNDLFEMNKNPLVSYNLDSGTSSKLDLLFKNIYDNIHINDLPEGIKGIHTYDHNILKLRKVDSKLKELIKIRNEVESIETFDKDIFLIIKNKINTPVELIIDNNLDLSGIVFLEGNLVINSKFTFKGIIILKGVDSNIVVNTTERPVLNGIVLTEGDTSFSDHIELKYDSGFICKYGIYLPGFLEPKLEVIKIQ